MTPFSILHRVSIPDPKTHLVHVETTVSAEGALADPMVLFMPVWTPGSYLVREYSRHVENLSVQAPARATKVRKNAWRIHTGGQGRVVVCYRVYAGELTVRTNHVDETHAFLVGSALFLCVEGREDLGARVEINPPNGWRVATSLPAAPCPPDERVCRFEALDFDTLVDCPIEIGTHREERFEAAGKTHRYAIWPASVISDTDARRLTVDTKAIIEAEAKLFGSALPYDAYDLLLHLSARARGGLEHRSSAALMAPPASFASRDGYLDLLSLVAHEVFHAWNIKRIRPAGLSPYGYEKECYTRLLWWFEGATSYYDWRILALARLCTIDEYLNHLAGEIAYLDQTPGRFVQALEDASFDAWIKLYRPDENSANSSVSYYRKGEVVCALIDIELRARTRGRATLDGVLSHLWREHGACDRPVPEDAMQSIFERVSGAPLADLFDGWIRSAAEIDYARTLAHVGLSLERSARADAIGCSLGMRVRSEGGRALVASVARDSSAGRAGIDPGDEVLAIGGLRIEGANVEATLRGRAPGDRVEVVVARDGRLLTKFAVVDPPMNDRVKIVAMRDAPASARNAFAAWLGAPHPAWSPASVNDAKQSGPTS
jgi:predicted metalloprotease with PDZ domain